MRTIYLLVRVMLALVPLSAMAADASRDERSKTYPTSYLVSVSTSECTKGCDAKYFQCAKGNSGKDMKRCADERKVCYQRCAAAASLSDCTKACDGKYAQCGKGRSGKDMKQCANERKVCYQRCT